MSHGKTGTPAPPEPNAAFLAEYDSPVTRVVVRRDGGTAGGRPGRILATVALAVAAAWIGGHLGESRFAMLVGGDGLRVSDDHGLATGLRIAFGLPGTLFGLARTGPFEFALGFLAIVVAAGGLAATFVGDARSAAARSLGSVGAILAATFFAIALFRLGGGERVDLLSSARIDAKQFPEWIARLDRLAAFDALMAVATAAWATFALRLPVAGWLRGLVATFGIAAAIGAGIAAFESGGTVDGFDRPRPMVLVPSLGGEREPLVGTIAGQPAAMSGGEFPGLHTLVAPRLGFTAPQSLRAFLTPPLD